MASLTPFYLRDFKNARRFNPGITPPRLQFAGFVEFVFNPDVSFLAGDNAIYREQISSLLQTATLPAVTFNTQVKNQYNIKRVVNTGVDYQPVELTVIDTVNNEWAVLLMRYFSYLYMNPRGKTEGNRDLAPKGYEDASITMSKASNFMADSFDSNAAGLDISNYANFINSIRMIVYHGGTGTEYVLFKPTITQFDLGSIDYTSSEFRTFRMQLEYENFTMQQSVNFQMSEEDLARFEEDQKWLSSAFADSPKGPILTEKPNTVTAKKPRTPQG